jgi:UDP-glucose 4-epimerase
VVPREPIAVRVLVTGGAGFIGSHVVDRLLAGGHRVHVVDNHSTGRSDFVDAKAVSHVCDIRSARLDDAFAAAQPDAVVHAAAQAAVARSTADPLTDASINVLGTIAVLAACRRHQVRRVVYVCTGGAAYGETDVLPTPEDHPLRPTSPYGVSKVAAELYLGCWQGITGARTLSLRLANVYGPRQNPLGEAGVIAIFVHRLLRGEPCIVHWDGEQTRDYVYVGDVADAVARALDRPEVTGILNIGTGVEVSVNDLYRRLARLAGVTREPEPGPRREGDWRRGALDATRAGKVLGWTPSTALDAGLATTMAYFKAGQTVRA